MDERLQVYDTKMTKSYDNLLAEFGAIRAGRANPHVLDRITVDYYGVPTPLQQVGNITVPEARMIQIQIWASIRTMTERSSVWCSRNLRRSAEKSW